MLSLFMNDAPNVHAMLLLLAHIEDLWNACPKGIYAYVCT